MTAPVATPAEVTHDAVTSAMLRHRRTLATLVLLALAAVCFWVVVALVRARTQPTLGVQMSRERTTMLGRPDAGRAGDRARGADATA